MDLFLRLVVLVCFHRVQDGMGGLETDIFLIQSPTRHRTVISSDFRTGYQNLSQKINRQY
jgi:hypothetical protein